MSGYCGVDHRSQLGDTTRVRFRFEDLELDTAAFELRRAGEAVRVEPQVFGVLACLVARHERLVSKDELLDEVWGTRFVSDATVASRVKAARRAIGDDGVGQRLIRTVTGRGYRFVAPVHVIGDGLVGTRSLAASPVDLVGRARELSALGEHLEAARCRAGAAADEGDEAECGDGQRAPLHIVLGSESRRRRDGDDVERA